MCHNYTDSQRQKAAKNSRGGWGGGGGWTKFEKGRQYRGKGSS